MLLGYQLFGHTGAGECPPVSVSILLGPFQEVVETWWVGLADLWVGVRGGVHAGVWEASMGSKGSGNLGIGGFCIQPGG